MVLLEIFYENYAMHKPIIKNPHQLLSGCNKSSLLQLLQLLSESKLINVDLKLLYHSFNTNRAETNISLSVCYVSNINILTDAEFKLQTLEKLYKHQN